MKKQRFNLASLFTAAFVFAAPALVFASEVVTVDQGFVKVTDADDEVTVDWRSGGTVTVKDTDQLLVDLGASRSGDHIRLSMAGDILFDFGDASLRSDATARLAKIAQLIRNEAKGDVVVVGHTDSKGDDKSNQALSERRAVSVIRWLHDQEGIPTAMMLGRGMGERQPIAPNTRADGSDNPAGREKNRRVDLYLATTANVDMTDMVISITGDNVDIGDIAAVDEDGNVSVDGVANIAADGTVDIGGMIVAGASDSISCAAGRTCIEDCGDGECEMICPAGAICDYECRGGNCNMTCASGARCDFACKGGNCRFQCATGAVCETSCKGDDCTGG